MRSIKECYDILELAIGCTESVIPSEILTDSITYLKELERKKAWENSDEPTLPQYNTDWEDMGK